MATQLTLYSFPGDFRALKALIAAKYNGVTIDTPEFEMATAKTPEFLEKNPLGKVPVLDTPQGSIFESNAIARYVGRLRRDTELYGASFFESGQVDSWLDFAAHELELPVIMWIYPILGFTKYNASLTEKAISEVHRALKVLDSRLRHNTFLVGNSITLADIVNVAVLFYPMKIVLDAEARAQYPAVQRWFHTCANQPEFKDVLGEVVYCVKTMVAEGAAAGGKKGGKKAGKKGGKEKKEQPKKKEKKAPAPAPAPAPKPKDPFADVPKSDFNLEVWKRKYYEKQPDHYVAMPWFWENYDPKAFSLWHAKYQYNQDNTMTVMTWNLVNGLCQRSQGIVRHAFAVMRILKKETPHVVEGVWLIKGQSIDPLVEANADAEYYDYDKLDEKNEEHRKLVADMWCAGENDNVNGMAVEDWFVVH